MDIKQFKDALPLLKRIQGYIRPDSTVATEAANLSYSARLRREADAYDVRETDFDAFDALVKALEIHDEKKEEAVVAPK